MTRAQQQADHPEHGDQAHGERALAAIESALREASPIQGGARELVALSRMGASAEDDPPWTWREHGHVRTTLRLICWDGPRGDGARSIVDIREQDAVIVLRELIATPPQRLRAYILGWADAVGVCLERMPDDCWAMPADLVFPRILQLKRPQAREHYAAALLVRSRLGRWMSGA